jgi:DNA-binding CsgD family transcriptional regulator
MLFPTSTRKFNTESSVPAPPLTPHEIRVLRLLADGYSVEAIAAALGVTPHAIVFHLRSIYAKLGVRSKLAAVVYALRHGLIE